MPAKINVPKVAKLASENFPRCTGIFFYPRLPDYPRRRTVVIFYAPDYPAAVQVCFCLPRRCPGIFSTPPGTYYKEHTYLYSTAAASLTFPSATCDLVRHRLRSPRTGVAFRT